MLLHSIYCMYMHCYYVFLNIQNRIYLNKMTSAQERSQQIPKLERKTAQGQVVVAKNS